MKTTPVPFDSVPVENGALTYDPGQRTAKSAKVETLPSLQLAKIGVVQ
jgi:hypothetical protein